MAMRISEVLINFFVNKSEDEIEYNGILVNELCEHVTLGNNMITHSSGKVKVRCLNKGLRNSRHSILLRV